MNRLSRLLITTVMVALSAIAAATAALLPDTEGVLLRCLVIWGIGWLAGASYATWCDRQASESHARRLEDIRNREPVSGVILAASTRGGDAWELPREQKRTGVSRWKEEL